jgi:DNA polymerase
MSVEDGPGAPFVGPAGRILDKALDAAGIGRDELYVTNAVKHFKFTVRAERGKRRIHQTPSRTEAVACRPWLLAELDAVEPDVVVLMGAVAAKSLLGNDFRLTAHRGELLHLATDDGMRNPDLPRRFFVGHRNGETKRSVAWSMICGSPAVVATHS